MKGWGLHTLWLWQWPRTHFHTCFSAGCCPSPPSERLQVVDNAILLPANWHSVRQAKIHVTTHVTRVHVDGTPSYLASVASTILRILRYEKQSATATKIPPRKEGCVQFRDNFPEGCNTKFPALLFRLRLESEIVTPQKGPSSNHREFRRSSEIHPRKDPSYAENRKSVCGEVSD